MKDERFVGIQVQPKGLLKDFTERDTYNGRTVFYTMLQGKIMKHEPLQEPLRNPL